MIVYAESSAVLAWLLDETAAANAARLLAEAEVVFSSDLTLVECDRALIRGVHLGEFDEVEAERRGGALANAATHWMMLSVSEEVIERARRPFAPEPVHTLDAIHLASALIASSGVADLTLLSLEDRVRRSARALGFALAPM